MRNEPARTGAKPYWLKSETILDQAFSLAPARARLCGHLDRLRSRGEDGNDQVANEVLDDRDGDPIADEPHGIPKTRRKLVAVR